MNDHEIVSKTWITLKSARAKAVLDELIELGESQYQLLTGGSIVASWAEQATLNIEYEKFRAEQIRQAMLTATMIDIEHQKLLATAGTMAASLKQNS